MEDMTGTIVSMAREDDGDYHLRLVVDAEFKKLTHQEEQDRTEGKLCCGADMSEESD